MQEILVFNSSRWENHRQFFWRRRILFICEGIGFVLPFFVIYRGPVGAMLTFLIILGVLLCCLRMARNHHLRCLRFRNIMKKMVEERVARFTARYHQDEDHQEDTARDPYVWDHDYSRDNRSQHHNHQALGYGNRIQTLIGGLYPTVSSLNQQTSLHQSRCPFPQLTISGRLSRIGSGPEPSTPLPSTPLHGLDLESGNRWLLGRCIPGSQQEAVRDICPREGARQGRITQISQISQVTSVYRAFYPPELSISTSSNSSRSA